MSTFAPRTGLEGILQAAGLTNQRALFTAAWAAQGSAPPGDTTFLDPQAVAAAARRIDLPSEHAKALIDGLDLFTAHPALAELAALVHRVLRSRQSPPQGRLWFWPMLPADLHPAAPLFHIWPILACVDNTVAFNLRRGITAETTLAGFQDIRLWMDAYRRAHGTFGFDEAAWMQLHITGELHRLGRLQFNLEAWQSQVLVLRGRRHRRPALLMNGEYAMRADGRFQGVARQPRDAAGFTTSFLRSADGWQGHPIDDEGRAMREHAFFAGADWEETLAPDDPVLSFHIPAGESLRPEACQRSFAEARSFFARHFPDRPFRAFVSHSWMFDATLGRHLAADANLIRFQRLLHLHPHPDDWGDQIGKFVFGRRAIDPQRTTATTSLQRIVLDHLANGGYWCQSGALLLPDELAPAAP